MALLAVVPVLGAFVVWIPAALFLASEGSWGKALILTLWGMIVVGTVDNLLRPILVGQRLRLHTVLVFISVVGGIIVFGPAGLILGPVVFTITAELLQIWRNRTAVDPIAGVEPNESSNFEREGRPSTCELPIEDIRAVTPGAEPSNTEDMRLTTK